MKRREFVFSSLKAAALLSPVLSVRRADAQSNSAAPMRVFFWVNTQGYPAPEDMFPSQSGSDYTMPFILESFESLRNEMVIIDGINIAETGFDNGNNHTRTIGKVLTAKDVFQSPDDPGDGIPGGISIDQLLARDLGWRSLEVLVQDRERGSMRERPFSLGPEVFKPGLVDPREAWARAFSDFTQDQGEGERQRRLRKKRSLLDDLTRDLSRLRTELAGVERLKLDIHEDAIRRAEQSVQRDIENAPAQCTTPPEPPFIGPYIPDRAAAHFDLMFAALACGRAQVGSMCWGHSGYDWRYDWVPGVDVIDTIHDEVHHRDGERRVEFALAAQWDWSQLAAFAERLKNTPEGTGTMLDNTLIVGISHFGRHHSGYRIPVVLLGNAQGRLQTGRAISLAQEEDNSKLLTTIAHLCGHPIAGFGDFPDCGPLAL